MFQITSDYKSEDVSEWCIFRLASDWFQTDFRLARRNSYCVFRFQIASDCFRFILDWQSEKKIFQTGSLKKNSFQAVV